VLLNILGPSSPATGSGVRRASGPNPFSRGPSGSSTGLILSAHNIGESCRAFCCISLTIAVVPIYDVRKIVDMNFYELDLDLDNLQRVHCEIPAGSYIVVAYTLNTWGRDVPVNVSFNIKWVMILGVPGSKN
jgi:hypothetical protein